MSVISEYPQLRRSLTTPSLAMPSCSTAFTSSVVLLILLFSLWKHPDSDCSIRPVGTRKDPVNEHRKCVKILRVDPTNRTVTLHYSQSHLASIWAGYRDLGRTLPFLVQAPRGPVGTFRRNVRLAVHPTSPVPPPTLSVSTPRTRNGGICSAAATRQL